MAARSALDTHSSVQITRRAQCVSYFMMFICAATSPPPPVDVLLSAHPLSAAAKATLIFFFKLSCYIFFNKLIFTKRTRNIFYIFKALLFASRPCAPVCTNQLTKYQQCHHWCRIQPLCSSEFRDSKLPASILFIYFFSIPLCMSNSHRHQKIQ